LFTYELARRCAGTTITANTLHPGWPSKTNLDREQHGAGGGVRPDHQTGRLLGGQRRENLAAI